MTDALSQDREPCIDALRLSDRDHQSLINELDRSACGAAGIDKRSSMRLPYHTARGLILQITHPGGTSVRFIVKPRNLSQNGLSVLHGGYIHPGTICRIPLRDLHDQPTLMRGSVVTCRHIRGRIHELGIHFDKALSMRDYVLDPGGLLGSGAQGGDGPIELPALAGRALVVDEWSDDRKLLSYDLRKLSIDVTEASCGADALQKVQRQRFHVILTGESLGDMTASDLTHTLRYGCDTPVIGIFSEGTSDHAIKAALAGVNEVIEKPYTIEHLSRLLLQYLSLNTSGDDGGVQVPAEMSLRWSEPGLRPMILSFVQGLSRKLNDLERQLTGPSAQDPLHTCHRLKGVAVGYGFPGLGEAAHQLASLIAADAALDDMHEALNHLNALAAAARQVTEQAAYHPETPAADGPAVVG